MGNSHVANDGVRQRVVICFHFSNFEPLETARYFDYLVG